jgi:nitrate reductase molybdenum cofactor assembly chaperone NarJ/NarW
VSGRGARRAQEAARRWKFCSLLLSYPGEPLLAAREELAAAVAELPAGPPADALARFCAWWTAADPLALASHYVETFDLDKRAGLYLTFYGEGDRRERGAALLRLKQLYRALGWPLADGELPDYLPALLELAAAAPEGRGELPLREHRAALELVRARLREQGSPYAHGLDAVCLALGEASPAERARAARIAAAGPPRELVGLEPFAPPEVMPASEARR